jgi:hypothetical protein
MFFNQKQQLSNSTKKGFVTLPNASPKDDPQAPVLCNLNHDDWM